MASRPYLPEGVRLKLARAYQHLEAVDREIGAFFEHKPYRTALYKDESD
jgi:hypothetical protein